MGVLRVKDGVSFDRIDPAGFRLLGSLDRVARSMHNDLTITCGSDSHPASDPHTLGRAYDVRTHDLTAEQKSFLLRGLMLDLQEAENDAPVPVGGGLATTRFFAFIEDPGRDNEHLHAQQRKGVSYP